MALLKVVSSKRVALTKDNEARMRRKARDNGCGELGPIKTEEDYDQALACAVPQRVINILNSIGEAGPENNAGKKEPT